ncbi:tail sheath subtilisin-like domain-containing protein [Campylobacter phage vB_CjeM_WX1]|nr:tail sheath subtilisin-like domain-containing protein [Campylobacter phage vB_CjeM_WX1]
MADIYDIPEFITQEVTIVTLDKEPGELNADTSVYLLEGESQPDSNYILSLRGANTELKRGDIIAFSDVLTDPRFRILAISDIIVNGEAFTNITYEGTEDSEAIVEATKGFPVYLVKATKSSCVEVPVEGSETKYDASEYELYDHTISNFNTFDEDKLSKPFVYKDAKLKIFAKTPGVWGNKIDVAIAHPDDFNKGKYITDGIPLDSQFDYIPYGDQFAVIVMYANEIQESFIVSLGLTDKNEKNEFTYIETMINGKSSYILVSVNESVQGKPKTCLGEDLLKLSNGMDSTPGIDDIIDAYTIFDNKEEIDVDILICNETYPKAATDIAITRGDCIAFMGAPKSCSVGYKSTIANQKTLDFRKSLNIDSKYVTLCSNYKYQYCAELGGYRWVNLAADIAGLKAQTNYNQANWYAAAGLNRGLIKNCEALAYSPTGAMRDLLYKNGINPVVMFPNTGAVLWGQKTLQTKASSFDRVNVVSLFNHLERSLGRMSKYSLFEFNDSFTRNYLVSIIKPFLAQVKAGRGIQDYLVICDATNNPASVIAANQLVIDVYIKPTYVAEFIHLRFVNVGANDFSVVVS